MEELLAAAKQIVNKTRMGHAEIIKSQAKCKFNINSILKV